MSDDGMVEMVIFPDKEIRRVVQKFKQPMDHVLYDPDNAITLAERIAAAAYEVREGGPPVGPALKAELADRHRRTLIRRLTVMLNSTREDKKISNSKLSQIVVETCLKEVFK